MEDSIIINFKYVSENIIYSVFLFQKYILQLWKIWLWSSVSFREDKDSHEKEFLAFKDDDSVDDSTENEFFALKDSEEVYVDSRDNEDSHEKEFLALKDDDSVDDSKEMKNWFIL